MALLPAFRKPQLYPSEHGAKLVAPLSHDDNDELRICRQVIGRLCMRCAVAECDESEARCRLQKQTQIAWCTDGMTCGHEEN